MKISAITLLLFLGYFSAQAQSAPPAPTHQQSGTTAALETSQPKIDPAKEADIRRLMEVAGSRALMTQLIGTIETSIKPMLTNIFPPGEYRDRLIDLFIAKFKSKADVQQLVESIVPLYDKYFSDKEIKDLTEFYETPLGRKTIEVLPKLFAESQQIGQKWGEALGRQSMIEVLNEHPDINKALEDLKNPAEPK